MRGSDLVSAEVRIARAYNAVAVRYDSAGIYPASADDARKMRDSHMAEARYEKSKLSTGAKS